MTMVYPKHITSFIVYLLVAQLWRIRSKNSTLCCTVWFGFFLMKIFGNVYPIARENMSRRENSKTSKNTYIFRHWPVVFSSHPIIFKWIKASRVNEKNGSKWTLNLNLYEVCVQKAHSLRVESNLCKCSHKAQWLNNALENAINLV